MTLAPRGARRQRARFPLMALAMLALLTGLWGGLLRLGWQLPFVHAPAAAYHGPLMIAGFLGTVIGLERAVALGRLWGYAAPLLTGLGALALVAGALRGVGPLLMTAGPLLMTAGSAGLCAVFVAIIMRQLALFTVVMAAGAGLWLAGQALWVAGWPIHRVAFWWAGFLVLTIAGERLELARLLRLSAASQVAFVAGVALFLTGLGLSVVDFAAGVRLLGVGLVALALWLARQDVARRTVRQPGLPRFIALCLLSGYGWLGASGLLAARYGGVTAGPAYDALLHALFLGFVFVMIFGHAPIIFPAVLGQPVAFRRAFYAHLALLHLTLALRVAGDLLAWLPGREWGGLGNAAALMVFFANTGYGILRPLGPPRPAPRAAS